MVSSAVEPGLPMEIDQIHQQFLADAAHETGRVPARTRIEPRRVHSHVTGGNAFATLRGRERMNGGEGKWKLSNSKVSNIALLSDLPRRKSDSWRAASRYPCRGPPVSVGPRRVSALCALHRSANGNIAPVWRERGEGMEKIGKQTKRKRLDQIFTFTRCCLFA